MDSGLTYAKAQNLRPGIALSAAQIALLTTDIAWLQQESVTLADGTVTQALVPHLYAAIRAGDLSPTGGLLSGDTVNLDATGEVRNGGTITAQNSLTAIAGRDLNEVSTTQSSAGKNVNLSAAQLVGAGNVAATAGNCPVLALIQEAAWMHWRSMRSPTRPRLPTILCRG